MVSLQPTAIAHPMVIHRIQNHIELRIRTKSCPTVPSSQLGYSLGVAVISSRAAKKRRAVLLSLNAEYCRVDQKVSNV